MHYQRFIRDIPQDHRAAQAGIISKGLRGRVKKNLLNILLTAALNCITIRNQTWIQTGWDLYQMEQITYS